MEGESAADLQELLMVRPALLGVKGSHRIRYFPLPWKVAGVDVSDKQSIAEVYDKIKARWKVKSFSLFYRYTPKTNPRYKPLGKKILKRGSVIYDIVDEEVEEIQDEEVLGWADWLVQDGSISFHRAGRMKNELAVWVSFRFPDIYELAWEGCYVEFYLIAIVGRRLSWQRIPQGFIASFVPVLMPLDIVLPIPDVGVIREKWQGLPGCWSMGLKSLRELDEEARKQKYYTFTTFLFEQKKRFYELVDRYYRMQEIKLDDRGVAAYVNPLWDPKSFLSEDDGWFFRFFRNEFGTNLNSREEIAGSLLACFLTVSEIVSRTFFYRTNLKDTLVVSRMQYILLGRGALAIKKALKEALGYVV